METDERQAAKFLRRLRDEVDRILAERDALRAALVKIHATEGKVCEEYEICTHPACRSSYHAWSIADAALRATAGQWGEGE